jgi:copper chaperone NosL
MAICRRFENNDMNNRLSIVSRILVAFASGALIAVFFLPAWRIDLFAPQYPEGLTMYIWINNLSGDVAIINGLNHYIGMKHITVDMFPEFSFLGYVVAFFMALGMAVAITGKRKFLFVYLMLTAVGGALAMIDFYKWGYDYGHHLDPSAPIQVPGLSYQPPLIGHKRLLNFDAYSFPDVAGWIVIGASMLAFGVWFVEWWKSRKGKKTSARATFASAASAAVIMVFFISCNTKPQPFNFGKDVCDFCKMTIVDRKFGGEVTTKKGKAYKFDDLHCLTSFLEAGSVAEKDISKTLVINYNKENDFIDVNSAFFVKSEELNSPMNGNVAGFNSEIEAKAIASEKSGSITKWNEIFKRAD